MAKANVEATAERVDLLQGMILAGEPNTACLTYARQTWGCLGHRATDAKSAASYGGVTGTTLTFISGRSIHRWPRTGWTSFAARLKPSG